MSNNLNSNPLFFDTTSTAAVWVAKFSAPVRIRQIQWIDDNGDLVHDSTLTLTINDVSFSVKIQPLNDQLAFGGVAYQAGPFNPGVPVSVFAVGAMATGNLLVWLD